MKPTRSVRFTGLLLLFVGALSCLFGCGSGSSTPPPTPPAKTLTSIAVSAANPSIAKGTTEQLTATGTDSDGSTQDLTIRATWSSSNTSVATISAAGLASAVAPGSTTIQASLNGVNGSTVLTVTTTTANLVGVFTQHNDNARTGQNLNETALTSSNVQMSSFGKRFSQPVDGQIYAQPLYAPNVSIAGNGTHNIIYVATEGDSVYAFNADVSSAPLWHASLIDAAHGATPGETTGNTQNDLSSTCIDTIPQVGITSTPVIDPSTGTMYVEAKSKKTDGTYVHRLHMLDITKGAEKSGGPQVIRATVPGTSDGGTTITFDPLHNLNRSGLLLVSGTVYIGYAGHCDTTPYHGWMFAYNAATLAQTAVYSTTPNGQ